MGLQRRADLTELTSEYQLIANDGQAYFLQVKSNGEKVARFTVFATAQADTSTITDDGAIDLGHMECLNDTIYSGYVYGKAINNTCKIALATEV